MTDKYGNRYPPRDIIEIVVSDSANSNWELTIDIVDKLTAQSIEAEDTSCQSSILCDNFKSRIQKEVKEHMLNKYPTTNFLIMAGEITPKAQPLDKLITKIWKGYFCDEYGGFILTDPLIENTGQPLPPTRQLLAQWILTAWDKFQKN